MTTEREADTLPLRPIVTQPSCAARWMVVVYLCLGHKEGAVNPSAHGVLIGLGSIIAACGALLIWVLHKSAAPMDFIQRHLGFSPDDGDGSMEVIILSVLVMIITAVAFRWEFK